MQIIIEILEEEYEKIKSMYIHNNATAADLRRIIANGTPLPKGHGRLIAEPTEEDIAKTVGGRNDFAECIRDAVRTTFENAPTIIEADKESE